MAASMSVIGVWETGDGTNYVLESAIEDDLPYIIPNYEKDWLEKFLNEKVESIDNYHKISSMDRGMQVPQELLDIQLGRLLLWREVRASIDGTLRQCDRVVEGVDLMGMLDYSTSYSFSLRSAHMDVVALFCLFQRGIELLNLFDKEFGSIANEVTHGGSKYVMETLENWFNERKSSIKLVRYMRNALCHANDFYSNRLRDADKVKKKFDGNLYRVNWLNIINDEIFVGVSPMEIHRDYCESDDEYNDLISKALANNFSIQELRALLIKCSRVICYTELDYIFKKRLGL